MVELYCRALQALLEDMTKNGDFLVDGAVSGKHFLHKLIYRHTWARGNQNSFRDYILVGKRLNQDILNVKVVRKMFHGCNNLTVVSKSKDKIEMAV